MKSFQNSRLILLLQSGSLVFLSVLLGILLMKSLWFCSLFTFFVILLFILHIDKQQQKLTEMVMRLITAIRFFLIFRYLSVRGVKNRQTLG